ncbi:MAG: thiol:disulfide interchange protein DsbD [Methyloprofundus sp.]|nr:MAG: thiol:disulfide interchange protein DsbD [Methyloprofundus sp.]
MNIKLFLRFCIVFFLSYTSVWAGAKAQIEIQAINAQQWPAHYQVTLTLPAHHHAYLDKGQEQAYIPVTLDPKGLLAKNGLFISHLDLPQGEYDNEAKATVLRHTGKIDFILKPQNKSSTSLDPVNHIALRYQLCDEVNNVCFRPQTVELALGLPEPQSQTITIASKGLSFLGTDLIEEDTDTSWMSWLLNIFHDNANNTLLLFALMFLAGLLSVATPCVYPMLPITSMLIVNRAQGIANKEKLHALTYLIGMVGTYVILGVMAGMTGGAFNSFMQSAFVNLAFALFFAFFAISLLGYYEFSFMQNEVVQLDQNTAKVKGYFGTWLMGSIAGLVISPCVGPIVFALLLQIADNIAAQAETLAALGQSLSFFEKLAIAMHGGILMSGFGLGVGLPFFLISVIKFKQLPKAGYWMNKVKYAFGFAILYFAYTYFAKGLGVLQVQDNVISMLAWSLVVLWFAIVHFNILSDAAHDQHPSRKLSRFAGVVALIVGGWLMVSGLNHVSVIDSAYANSSVRISNEQNLHDQNKIAWIHSFEQAQRIARSSGKPIFIDFYASWCANCLAFSQETIDNQELNRTLREQAVPLKIIDKTPEFEAFKNMPEHRQLKIGLPYFAILNSDGILQWSGTDYKASQTMIKVLQRL